MFCTNSLLLVPTPLVFAYYSNLFLDGIYRRLVLNIARSKFAICSALQLLWVAASGLTDTFNTNKRLRVSNTYLVALEAPVVDLITRIRLENIV